MFDFLDWIFTIANFAGHSDPSDQWLSAVLEYWRTHIQQLGQNVIDHKKFLDLYYVMSAQSFITEDI